MKKNKYQILFLVLGLVITSFYGCSSINNKKEQDNYKKYSPVADGMQNIKRKYNFNIVMHSSDADVKRLSLFLTLSKVSNDSLDVSPEEQLIQDGYSLTEFKKGAIEFKKNIFSELNEELFNKRLRNYSYHSDKDLLTKKVLKDARENNYFVYIHQSKLSKKINALFPPSFWRYSLNSKKYSLDMEPVVIEYNKENEPICILVRSHYFYKTGIQYSDVLYSKIIYGKENLDFIKRFIKFSDLSQTFIKRVD